MSWRKGSTVSNDTSAGSNGSRGGPIIKMYPFALALRIRVVQIVCGISEIVMGSVAMIEERSACNLGMSLPAGCVIMLASSWSVHRSFHRELRWPLGSIAWSRFLWCTGCSFQLYLLYITIMMMVGRHYYGIEQFNNTRLGLAIVESILAVCSILACLTSFRIRFIYGNAPSLPPPERANCPRSTSHTAVSMVPMICNPPISLECKNNNGDNSSSENEMEEIILPGNGTIKEDLSPVAGDISFRDTTQEAATLAVSIGGNGYTNKTNDAVPNKTIDVTPNKSNEATPNKMKDNGGADTAVGEPSKDRVPNSVEFNLSNSVTQKSNNCNGHSKSTKVTM